LISEERLDSEEQDGAIAIFYFGSWEELQRVDRHVSGVFLRFQLAGLLGSEDIEGESFVRRVEHPAFFPLDFLVRAFFELMKLKTSQLNPFEIL